MSRKHNGGEPFSLRLSIKKLQTISAGGTIELEGRKRKVASIKSIKMLSNGDTLEINGIVREEKQK